MREFLDYLTGRRKSAYGTCVLRDSTDGLFFVLFYGQPRCKREETDVRPSARKQEAATMVVFKYILGLGLDHGDAASRASSSALASPAKDAEDYLVPSVLGSLLRAQSKTKNALLDTPKGSVQPCPKPQSLPRRRQNPGHCGDWHGARLFLEAGGDESDDD